MYHDFGFIYLDVYQFCILKKKNKYVLYTACNVFRNSHVAGTSNPTAGKSTNKGNVEDESNGKKGQAI